MFYSLDWVCVCVCMSNVILSFSAINCDHVGVVSGRDCKSFIFMYIVYLLQLCYYDGVLLTYFLQIFLGYVTDVLDDAKAYSNHANKKEIDVDDVKLAVDCRLDHSFTTPPPRDVSIQPPFSPSLLPSPHSFPSISRLSNLIPSPSRISPVCCLF